MTDWIPLGQVTVWQTPSRFFRKGCGYETRFGTSVVFIFLVFISGDWKPGNEVMSASPWCFLPMQSLLTSFWSSLTGLVQLTFSFPSWFDMWYYCSHTFLSFLKLNSAFRLDRKTWSQRSYVFRLTGTAALHCGYTFVGGILTVDQTCKECLSQNKMPATNVVQIHTHVRFPWRMANLAYSRTNRKRSSFATKIFQRKSLKLFDLHLPLRKLVSFVARIIVWKWDVE